MASEMQADVDAAKWALQKVIGASEEALMWVKQIDIELNRRVPSLSDQHLGRASRGMAGITEDQIVAALKSDPAMAGRVMVSAAFETEHGWKMLAGSAAGAAASTPGIARALRSLAVALAAASYRG